MSSHETISVIFSFMDVDERYSVFAQVGPAVSSHALHASNYIPVHTHELPSFPVRMSIKDAERKALYCFRIQLFRTTSVLHDSQSPRRPRPSDAIRKENFGASVNRARAEINFL